MKCEQCHKAEAETVLVRGEGEDAEELYVCRACAKAERQRRQKKSQRTRKITGLPPGMEMSVTEISGGEGDGDGPPPFFGAIMDAVHDLVTDIEKAHAKETEKKEKKVKYHDFPLSRVDGNFRIGNRLHLEGLYLIGEIDAVKRAARALKMELTGVTVTEVKDAGHVYLLRYSGTTEQARRVVEDILKEEVSARERLIGCRARIFGDSLCRALAILKNCRMLSPGELFDLLSPLRIAAQVGMLDGITRAEIERKMLEIDLTGAEENLEPREIDRADCERADEVNRCFEDVVLNERAEGCWL